VHEAVRKLVDLVSVVSLILVLAPICASAIISVS
jgi:hypothetical protein